MEHTFITMESPYFGFLGHGHGHVYGPRIQGQALVLPSVTVRGMRGCRDGLRRAGVPSVRRARQRALFCGAP